MSKIPSKDCNVILRGRFIAEYSTLTRIFSTCVRTTIQLRSVTPFTTLFVLVEKEFLPVSFHCSDDVLIPASMPIFWRSGWYFFQLARYVDQFTSDSY